MHGPEVILVTGSAGFIGRSVTSGLVAAGKDVVSLDSKPSAAALRVQHLKCDITDATRVREIFGSRPVGTVVHLASVLRTASIQNPKLATQVNIMAALNILEAAREFRVPRVVYSSSISVYGSKCTGDITELAPTSPEDVYGATKTYVEVLGEAYARKYGIEFVAVRIPVVVGSGATGTSSPWRSEIFEMPRQTRAITIPYDGTEILPLVHVQDLADMFAILINSNAPAFSKYNSPCEIWRLEDLKSEIERLNNNLQIRFGNSRFDGGPRRINADRFRTEFSYAPVPLTNRLRDAVHRSIEQPTSRDLK